MLLRDCANFRSVVRQLQDMQEAAGSSQPIMADGSVKKCLRSNGEMVHDHEQEDRKKRDMFVEEMEQAHADELTAQAEEIVNLQDEIKETGAALEAKDSEVVQLRFQLIMLEKIYREKKEEHANLVASMKAVEGIWEREHSHAEQRERVLLTEIQWLRDKLGERDRQWEVSFQQLMQEAVRREDLLRTLNQGTDQSGESVMSWLWSPSVTSSQSPVVSYQSGTRTKSIFFDDEFLHEVLHDVLHDEFRMSSMTKALGSPQEGKSDGGSGGPLTWNLPPLPAPPRPLGESDLAAIRQHLPVPFQQLGDSAGAGERERARETAGDQKGDAPTDLHRTRSPHASYLSNRGGTSTTDSTLSRVLDPFDGNSAGIRVHGESLAQKSGPADVLKEDIHAWRPPPTRPLTPSPAPATPLSLPFDPDLSLNSPTSVWSTESDMKWSY